MSYHPLEVPNRISEANFFLRTPEGENSIVWFNVDKIECYYETAKTLQEQLAEELKESFADLTGEYKEFNPSSRNDMLLIFKKYLNISENDLMFEGRESIGKEVIRQLSEKYNSPFISLYIQYNEQASIAKNLKWYYENVKHIPGCYNNEGDRIGYNPRFKRMTYRLQDTFRFNTYEPNIQGIDKQVCDIITAPEGWVVVQVDSSQIEPKIYYSTVIKDPLIKWLIEQYNDVYYALADYCLRDNTEYTPDNLYMIDNLNKEFRPTLKTLVNAGNYGSSLDKLKRLSSQIYKNTFLRTEEGKNNFSLVREINSLERQFHSEKTPARVKAEIKVKLDTAYKQLSLIEEKGHELAERFYSRIVKHPDRIAHEKEINDKINNRDRTVLSPFGDERVVSGNTVHLKNCFINNPIQMAVSRLSAISVCEAFLLSEARPDLVRYAFLKHDEDVYYVKAEHAEYITEKFLKPLRQYEIEGWAPIYADAKISLDYTKD